LQNQAIFKIPTRNINGIPIHGSIVSPLQRGKKEASPWCCTAISFWARRALSENKASERKNSFLCKKRIEIVIGVSGIERLPAPA